LPAFPMRCFLFSLSLFAGSACGGAPPATEPGASQSNSASVNVRTYGSLKATIEDRMLDKVVSLAQLRGDRALVGFGLLSALRGEVVLVNGEAWLSYPNTDGTVRSAKAGANDETLAFLVAATVPEWQDVPLTEDIEFDALDDVVERLAKSARLDTEKPIPFVVEGALVNLNYSVVNGAAFAAGGKLSREALKAASPKVKLASAQGTLVGFFSREERPEFLEPGTNVHVHVVVSSRNEAGHVDSVDLPRGTALRFPVPGRR
jgi:alpha-acetolactate decarboxylase